MELITFHEKIYGKYQSKLFLFEPTWDSFRPIIGVGWDGYQFSNIYTKQNLFSEWYGYESPEEKKLCRKLIEETELANAKEIKDPIQFWRWYGETNVKWWRDRPCVFASQCVSRDNKSWKKYLSYLESKAKTLRQPFRGRATKRLVPK